MALFGLFKKDSGRTRRGRKPLSNAIFQPKIDYIPKTNHKKTIHRNTFNWKPYLFALLGIITIILIYLGFDALFSSTNAKVRNFDIIGNRTINDAQVLTVLDKFRDQSIYLINPEIIEKELQAEFNIFNGVWVRKYYPDTLSIRISEREPRLVYLSLSGAFLVDAEGQVLRKIFVDPVVVSEEKMNIARGFGDPNSEYLKDIFLNDFKINNQALDLTQDELSLLLESTFDYEQITLEEKQRKLNELEIIYKEELDEMFEKINRAVDVSVYSTYQRVDVMDSAIYEEDGLIDISRLNFTSDLINLFSSRKIQINRVIWEGELLIKVITVDGKELVFGSVRKVTEQFEDYVMVLNQIQKEGKEYCRIDLSGIKIAVRSCR